MRFVVSDTVRIPLKDSVDKQGNKVENWIEVRQELSKGEDAKMRSYGLKRMSQGNEKETNIDVDWQALAMGRVIAYLVDWSAKNEKTGKDIAVSPQAIAELDTADFDEIDEAIKKHIAETDEAKKIKPGKTQPATT